MERLTDDRFLKDGFYQPKSNEEEKEIRSMGNDLTFEKLYKHCAEVEKQNAELQKQVDELKERLRLAYEECDGDYDTELEDLFEACKKDREQAVKDTAKEIYEILEKWAWKLKNEKGSLGHFRFAIETAMQEIKQKYSLEVRDFKLVELKKGKGNEKV